MSHPLIPYHDSVLMLSFGGPEKMEDVRPFLENVTRGRPVPPQRLEEVVRHYEAIGGRSPITEMTRQQARSLERVLRERYSDRSLPQGRYSPDASGFLPVYVGMRNWHPLPGEVVTQMQRDGKRRAVGLIMSTHRCEASWERYQREVDAAVQGAGVDFCVDYTQPFYDHPGFIEATADLVGERLQEIPSAQRADVMLLFSVHSIPVAMAEESGYVDQCGQSCRRVAERLRHGRWRLCFQSRSGRPTDPWLEPDILEALKALSAEGVRHVVVAPIGFVCDHIEVLYDLDIAAANVAREVGLNYLRARTVSDHLRFIAALADRVLEVAR